MALLSTQVGCATLFTGTRQDVPIDSAPPGATVVVLQGTPALVALKAKRVSDFKDGVVNLFGDSLTPEARAFLLSLSTDELVTQLVLWLRLSEAPPELAAGARQVGQLLGLVPAFVRDRVSDFIGIAAVATTPVVQNLRKGQEYAVVTWARGHRARLLMVETTFNWVTLLNVFIAVVPAVVDVLTGAWLKLTPTELTYTLDPLPPEPDTTPAPAPRDGGPR